MPSDLDRPPIRDLLLVLVFQLGLCVLLLAEVVDATRGYDTLVGLFGRVLGTATAAGAVLASVLRRRVAVE
ncbi:hypothetical protein ACFQE1_20405 [Halobium palmae]|uniref:Uncharacterized protein n=1 Tax=Halobium palmae TaxID=1776492 RepID=A0ABD5S596_9EURY